MSVIGFSGGCDCGRGLPLRWADRAGVIGGMVLALAVLTLGCDRSGDDTVESRSDPVPVVKEAAPEPSISQPEPLPQSEPTPQPQTVDQEASMVQAVDVHDNDASTIADPAKRAAEALRSGDVDAAYRYAREAMFRSPQDPQVVFLMARVLGRRQRFPEAVRMLDRLAEAHPETRLPGLGQSSEWLVLHGDYAGAETRLRTILDEVPTIAMPHRALARLLLGLGRRAEAEEHLRRLCRMGDVNDLELVSLLRISSPLPGGNAIEPLSDSAAVLSLVGENRFEEARQRLLEIEQPDELQHALLGRLAVLLGDTDALSRWSQTEQTQHGSVHVQFVLAAQHVQLGDDESATRHLCRVVMQDPTDDHAYRMLSGTLERLGLDEASRTATQRWKWIHRTHVIAAELNRAPNDRFDLIGELVQILDQLQRHDESLAWQSMQVIHGQAVLTKQQAIERMGQINRRRMELSAAGTLGPDDEFIRCGVDLESLAASE
ncbi:Tetratricopeptide repeat protein [Stieleria maiorica]|uniref:Tetratricopeptide repeat protein n=1 Tax=Stieleria maiorica TaxID=2795974 RepID=A0A5B9MNC7_9BACT|nr:tetratricopeptide repeat protein [Stieleria maiorica]QEG01076.1 Tetratricopeptide repeat protein [Stieleria maiorica]